MQDLKVVGVEDGALVAATENGERYRIVIDEVLHSYVRPPRLEQNTGPRISPKDIQAHIRSGLSAEEVAELTGATLDYVRRFERPVLAEREHIVGQALSVPVIAPVEAADGEEATFGAAIRARLDSLSASGERWTSWKDAEDGWIVKVSFTSGEVDHDARWTFEPKRQTLSPQNSEAMTLSRQGEMPNGLIPRLRAVEPDGNAHHDDSRFDSGAFAVERPSGDDDLVAVLEPLAFGRNQTSSKAAAAAAVNRGDDAQGAASTQTADLLEALRKRRGEREPADYRGTQTPATSTPSSPEPAQLFDIPIDSAGDKPAEEPPLTKAPPTRKGRTSMPSWDEIVFGARTEDD
ncbi:septation protein SepH [Labedella endophytica]|uniref:DUF3071 domain-containing protein n=1 Tax=Labedella endophytica TaxID=1523160 RepID=A0A433JR05_9MICO|nr:septation protein SepH [Labedella endophytica]RUR00763.1 DUF3071 domain-containing protein [Labedella endophytica]